MKVTDRMIEAAEANVSRECESAIARIRAHLAEEGEDVCIDCDEPIGAARKAALPSAERCIDCQNLFERMLRGSRAY
jgi:phage/conjugal plasmid C-4 type zinc finger TraR family protein